MNGDGEDDWVASLSMEFRGGENDGLQFKLVETEEGSHWVSDSFPGQKFKQVFVPFEMKHPAFVGQS